MSNKKAKQQQPDTVLVEALKPLVHGATGKYHQPGDRFEMEAERAVNAQSVGLVRILEPAEVKHG